MKITSKSLVNIQNKKAYHEYQILETLECGISLRGNEVKSIIAGKASIKEAWCAIQNNQLMIRGMHITPWNTANAFDVDETRERVLLAHKSEIHKLLAMKQQDGITLIPLSVTYRNNHIKVIIGVCKGKKLYDKRQDLKERQTKRDMDRMLKQH